MDLFFVDMHGHWSVLDLNVSCVCILVLALASHWLEGLCKFYANAGENENHA